MVNSSIFIALSRNENSTRLRLNSDVEFPLTRSILFGKRLKEAANMIKWVSSLNGIMTQKVPSSDSNFAAHSIKCSNGIASVNLAKSRFESSVL